MYEENPRDGGNRPGARPNLRERSDMDETTVRTRCSWVYPYCLTIATKWIKAIPLCDEHYSEVAPLMAPRPPMLKPVPFVPWSSVVYYVTWPGQYADQVKIGVSARLSQRLVSLRRSGQPARVIVAEPGDHKTERRRHREFSAIRLLGRADGGETELFRRVPLLDEHMVSLRKTHPDWATRSKL